MRIPAFLMRGINAEKSPMSALLSHGRGERTSLEEKIHGVSWKKQRVRCIA